MRIDIEKMRKRNEELTAEAKHLEFDALADSAVKDKIRRVSPSKESPLRISNATVVCAFLVVLLILAVSYISHIFKSTPLRNTNTESLADVEKGVVGESVDLDSDLDNTPEGASSFTDSSPTTRVETTALKQKHITAIPAKRAYTQRDLSGMPPDVRAEATGR